MLQLATNPYVLISGSYFTVVDSLESHLDDEFHSAVKAFYGFYRAGKEILSDCSDTSADIPVLEGRLQVLYATYHPYHKAFTYF